MPLAMTGVVERETRTNVTGRELSRAADCSESYKETFCTVGSGCAAI